MNKIIHSNLFYFKKLCKIGGTEQFLYEIAKKYGKDYDITICYDEADINQLKRLSKYVKCIRHINGYTLTCKRAFFNYNVDAINDIVSLENYYAFVSHANFEEIGWKPPIDNKKINHYISVSNWASNKLEKYANDHLKMNIKVRTCYNPLNLEPKEKILHLVSAGRLDDITRGAERYKKFIKALDEYCTKNNRHYVWHVFSNPMFTKLESINVVLMQPRLDIRPYIADSDFLINLANDMETYGYSDNEAWSYGVRTVTTPLSVNKELPIPDGANLIVNWDMSNVNEIIDRMFNEPLKPFKYKAPDDDWDKLLVKDKPKNKKPETVKVKCRIKEGFFDYEINDRRKFGDVWETDKERALYLYNYIGEDNLTITRLIDIIE